MRLFYYVIGFAIIFIAVWMAIVWIAWLASMNGSDDLTVVQQMWPITLALLWIGGIIGFGCLGVYFIDKGRFFND